MIYDGVSTNGEMGLVHRYLGTYYCTYHYCTVLAYAYPFHVFLRSGGGSVVFLGFARVHLRKTRHALGKRLTKGFNAEPCSLGCAISTKSLGKPLAAETNAGLTHRFSFPTEVRYMTPTFRPFLKTVCRPGLTAQGPALSALVPRELHVNHEFWTSRVGFIYVWCGCAP